MTRIGDTSRGRERRWGRTLFMSFVILCAVTLIIGRMFFGEVVRYRGDQMHPAIQDGDWLLIDHRPILKKGDLVLLLASPRPVIRRITKTEGQLLAPSMEQKKASAAPQRVPKGQAHTECAKPSQCPIPENVGLVNLRRIKGVVVTRWAAPF